MKLIPILQYLSPSEFAMPELFGDVPPPQLTHEENRTTVRPWAKRRRKGNRLSAYFQEVRERAARMRGKA